MIVRVSTLVLLVFFWVGSASAESGAERFAKQVAAAIGATEGSIVADIGAGDGSYAVAMSQIVGTKGKVFATELEAEDRAEIQSEADEAGASNVEVMQAEFQSTGLAAACCDAIYLRRVYHHLTDPEPFGKSLYETLRPGGRLAIVDFRPFWLLALFTPEGIPEDRGGHGIMPDLVEQELEAAGFVHVETREEWDPDAWFNRDFGVIFEKPANGS